MVGHFSNNAPLSVDMFTSPSYHVTLPTDAIACEFGEVLGPIAIHQRNLLSANVVFFPTLINEPLIDYKMIGSDVYKISAKSKNGSTSNTIKPVDILSLLKNRRSKVAKWKNTLQYQILEALAQYSIKEYPIVVGKLLSREFLEFEDFLYGTEIQDFVHFANRHSNQTGEQTDTFILYYIEKMICNYSKTHFDLSPLFFDAIDGEIHYAAFRLSVTKTQASTNLSLMDKEYFSSRRAVLRTKNSTRTRKDRLGIQI